MQFILCNEPVHCILYPDSYCSPIGLHFKVCQVIVVLLLPIAQFGRQFV